MIDFSSNKKVKNKKIFQKKKTGDGVEHKILIMRIIDVSFVNPDKNKASLYPKASLYSKASLYPNFFLDIMKPLDIMKLWI